MKGKKLKRIASALAIICIPLLEGCGKSNSTPLPGTGVAGGVFGGGACIPVNAPQIPFTGTNIYFSSVNIRGGIIPGKGTEGQVVLGGTAIGGPYQRSGVDGVISMNIIPMQGMYPPTYPNTGTPTGNIAPTRANATGFITISSATQQDILYKFGGTGTVGYNPYLPGAAPQPMAPNYPCISAIAIDVGHYYNTIYGGNVFVYLNNTQHGYALYF